MDMPLRRISEDYDLALLRCALQGCRCCAGAAADALLVLVLLLMTNRAYDWSVYTLLVDKRAVSCRRSSEGPSFRAQRHSCLAAQMAGSPLRGSIARPVDPAAPTPRV